MVARHKQFIADNGLDSICGRIYISKQGINCQGGGLKAHTEQYVSWVGSQPEFQGLFHTLWPAEGPMFPKLRLKLKPNLISLAGENGITARRCWLCLLIVSSRGVTCGWCCTLQESAHQSLLSESSGRQPGPLRLP